MPRPTKRSTSTAGTPPTRPSCSPPWPTDSHDAGQVYVRGIEMVRPLDIRFAKELGYVVKLLSIVREHEDHSIEIRTQPSFIPRSFCRPSIADG